MQPGRAWTYKLQACRYLLDTVNNNKGKPSLRYYYSRENPSKKMEFMLAKKVVLPKYQKGDSCVISIITRGNFLGFWLRLNGIDKDGNELGVDNIYIKGTKNWQEHSVKIALRTAKAIRSMFFIKATLAVYKMFGLIGFRWLLVVVILPQTAWSILIVWIV